MDEGKEKKTNVSRWLSSKRPRREDIRKFILTQGKIQCFRSSSRSSSQEEKQRQTRRMKQSTLLRTSYSKTREDKPTCISSKRAKKKRIAMKIEELDDGQSKRRNCFVMIYTKI